MIPITTYPEYSSQWKWSWKGEYNESSGNLEPLTTLTNNIKGSPAFTFNCHHTNINEEPDPDKWVCQECKDRLINVTNVVKYMVHVFIKIETHTVFINTVNVV